MFAVLVWIIWVWFAVCVREDNFGVIEMCFVFEVKIFGKWFGKCDIGDGVVISQIVER